MTNQFSKGHAKTTFARGMRGAVSATLLVLIGAAGLIGCGSSSTGGFGNAAPSITQLSPATGAPGTAVVISGANFGASQSAASGTVTFNNTTAPVISWSNSSIVAEVPSGSSTGSVVVTVSGRATGGSTFTVNGGLATCESSATNIATFSGSYAYLMGGFEGAGAVGTHFVRVGSITIANNLITGGEEDLNVGGLADVHHTVVAVSSGFSVGPDNRGCMNLTFSDSTTVTFRFTIGSFTGPGGTAIRGHIIEFDDAAGTGMRAAGVLLQQTTSAFVATALGTNYAFGLGGFNSAHGHVAEAGTFTLAPTTAANNITNGFMDVNNAGTQLFAGGTPGTSVGTLLTEPAGTISATSGRTTSTIIAEPVCAATCTYNYVVYIVNANQAFVMSKDTLSVNTPLVSGRAIATFAPSSASLTAASWAGEQTGSLGFLLSAGGANASVAESELGQLIFTSGGTYTSTLNTYSSGTPATTSPSGTYAISSAGRLTFTSGTTNLVLYLTNSTAGDSIAAFAIDTTNEAIGGNLITQGSAAFSASGNGSFHFGTAQMGDNTVQNDVGVAGTQVSGSGTSDKISGVEDQSGPTGLGESTFTNTAFTLSATGAITATDSGGHPIVGFADGGALFFIDESGSAAVNVVQQ
jgi:hypothetical protein